MERGCAGAAVVAAARGLAVDRHEVGALGPAFPHPAREGGGKERGVDPVHQDGEPALAGDAVRVGPRPVSRPPAAPAPTPATSSPPAPSTPSGPPTPSAGTGPSRTASTGSSTSPSATTSPACARVTAPGTWPPSALRPQPRPRRRRQAIGHVPPQARRVVAGLSPLHPLLTARVTWIRSPVTCGPRIDMQVRAL